MGKILLLNGSHSELTLIREIKKLGHYVITTGNLPSGLAHKYADEYIQEDYSDKEAILNIAKAKKVNGIVSCANDFGIITASYVADELGLPGYDCYEKTLLLHQKDLFKDFALKINMQVPNSVKYESIDDAIANVDSMDYPIIIKPVDLTGGKGCSCVRSNLDYEIAVKKAFSCSRKKVIVVEKFVEGTYHSFSTFLVDRKVVAFYSDNEYSNVYRFFVDTSAGPADYEVRVKDLLIKQAEMIAEKLNLVDGIFHMQYVMNSYKEPFIIDITRRCSGDIYPEPVEHSTGIPWSKWIVLSELGYPIKICKHRKHQRKICGRHCIMAEEEGNIKDVKISDEIRPFVYKDIQWWKQGDEISNHLVDKAGIIFYEFPDISTMKYIVSNIKSMVKVELG